MCIIQIYIFLNKLKNIFITYYVTFLQKPLANTHIDEMSVSVSIKLLRTWNTEIKPKKKYLQYAAKIQNQS